MTTAAIEYARALYGLAEDESLQDEIYPQVTEVERLLEAEPVFLKILGAPNISREERCGLIDRCFGQAVHPYLVNTLKLMTEKGCAFMLPECCRAYDKLYQEGHGIITVKAYTAAALTAAQSERLVQKLRTMTGKQIRLENIIRPECLGGVRLDLDGRQIDDTVRHRLDEMRDLLSAAAL